MSNPRKTKASVQKPKQTNITTPYNFPLAFEGIFILGGGDKSENYGATYARCFVHCALAGSVNAKGLIQKEIQ